VDVDDEVVEDDGEDDDLEDLDELGVDAQASPNTINTTNETTVIKCGNFCLFIIKFSS
jgi:hypothetical protein